MARPLWKTFNLSSKEAEAGGSLSARPPWSREWVPRQPEKFLKSQTNKK